MSNPTQETNGEAVRSIACSQDPLDRALMIQMCHRDLMQLGSRTMTVTEEMIAAKERQLRDEFYSANTEISRREADSAAQGGVE